MTKVLIVSDDQTLTSELEGWLHQIGYMVPGCASTESGAIRVAEEERPDIVLIDTTMRGEASGALAAEIQTRMHIPVIYITPSIESVLLNQGRSLRPYSCLLRPLTRDMVRSAIEVAVATHHAETGQMHTRGEDFLCVDEGAEDHQAILLDGFFSDITLYVYSPDVKKTPIFRRSLYHGILNHEFTIYAYYRSSIGESFRRHISEGDLHLFRISKEGIGELLPYLDTCCREIIESSRYFSIRFLIDLSHWGDFNELLAIKTWILEKRDSGFPISGVLSLPLETLDQQKISVLSHGISRVVIASGVETTLSFTDSYCANGSLKVVQRELLEDGIKKTLEPLVLSLVLKQMSGYEILHEINNRYRILIPQSRIYGLLYDLEARGIIHPEQRGKAKVYKPTEEGESYIKERLKEFTSVYLHILGELDL